MEENAAPVPCHGARCGPVVRPVAAPALARWRTPVATVQRDAIKSDQVSTGQ
jgi:hypothetical protein